MTCKIRAEHTDIIHLYQAHKHVPFEKDISMDATITTLLMAHKHAFAERFERMLYKQQRRYTISFTLPEYVAFLKLWIDRPIPDVQQGLVINQVIEVLQKIYLKNSIVYG